MIRRLALTTGLSLALWGAVAPQQPGHKPTRGAGESPTQALKPTADRLPQTDRPAPAEIILNPKTPNTSGQSRTGTTGSSAQPSSGLVQSTPSQLLAYVPAQDIPKPDTPAPLPSSTPTPTPIEPPPQTPDKPLDLPTPAPPEGSADDPFNEPEHQQPAAPAPTKPPTLPRDERVLPTQNPGDLPISDPSAPAPAGSPAPSAAVDPPPQAADPAIIPPDRLPTGANAMGVTLEVRAPTDSNINVDTPVLIAVRNMGRGTTAALSVTYPMPEGLQFVSATPTPSQTLGNLHIWQLDSLAAGATRELKVTVRPIRTGQFDHAPTVTLRGGAKTRTLVREPKLKVEMTSNETQVQRGKLVKFEITVTNTGDGVARDVVLQAQLSPGLRHESQGNDSTSAVLTQALKDSFQTGALKPGESRVLPLELDAVEGGEQTCTVTATSPDVAATDIRSSVKIMVVEPKLKLTLAGSKERYPDTTAHYVITVENPGTATAKQVQVAAQVPTGGQPENLPAEASFDSASRRIYWDLGDLDAGKKTDLHFYVHMGNIGLYRVDAWARAATLSTQSSNWSTQVVGMAEIQVDLKTRRRVLDVGEETLFELRLHNTGSTDANKVLVKAVLTDQLVILETSGTDKNSTSSSPDQPRDAIFPEIERLPAGAKMTLSIRVKAVADGDASCKVSVAHDNVPPVERSQSVRITRPVE